jgi:hypothetical protein
MRILLSWHSLVGFRGTETYLLTVAAALERLGHDVLIHAPETGPCADFARARGTRVIEQEAQLPASTDVVLAQDAATAYTMACRYPRAVRVFVAHSTAFPLQTPPQLDGICQAVVAMNERVQRHVEQLAWHPRVVRLRQPIDLQRFCFRATYLEQRRPPRVLWLSNNSGTARRRMLECACEAAGLKLRRIGQIASPTATPEDDIAEAEIVISLGRGVLEAMASGRAAYVFGVAGGDGWVTADSYPALERDGFSGRAFSDPVGLERLTNDLTQWREEMGEVGRDLACTHHDADHHAVQLLELIEDLDGPSVEPPSAASELARLVRLEWQQRMEARFARRAHLPLRRYRWADRIASPLDRLRARRERARDRQ